MNCVHCHNPLNSSQFRNNGTLKSCPNCSTNNGQEHVYYPYPNAFGTTPLRASDRHPEGPQSYCVACRGGQSPDFEPTLCHNTQP